MSESKQQLIAEKERVWDQDGELVATVWARRPDETRLPGEAWIDMRMRIGPALDAAAQETFSLARQFASAPELVEALQSIAQYGSDTLSGRTDGPDDRDWQREAVLEMTRRARAALAKAGAIDQTRAAKPVAEAARHPTICSFCLEPNCNGECSGDGGMGD
ncbi:hypothetical protein [Burkholderia gladioli]|uniref:hypothetical protein n=1 Tax=Burkholderia gladioli TaxID=28095 RepID=UPI0016408424|nr:hypothetical protein [Burkholderia gladioli]